MYLEGIFLELAKKDPWSTRDLLGIWWMVVIGRRDLIGLAFNVLYHEDVGSELLNPMHLQGGKFCLRKEMFARSMVRLYHESFTVKVSFPRRYSVYNLKSLRVVWSVFLLCSVHRF